MSIKQGLISIKKIILLIILINISSECSSHTTRKECLAKNNINKISTLTSMTYSDYKSNISSYCCWNSTENTCAEFRYDIKNPHLWRKEGIDCGLHYDVCENTNNPDTKKYVECLIHPSLTLSDTDTDSEDYKFKCCYVGNGRHNKCMFLDTKKKKIYKQVKFYQRAENEDYDGDYEIICSASYRKVSIMLILSLLYFLV